MFIRNRSRLPQHRLARFGFTLIELAIVLGVVGVLSAGLWRLMTAGSQQTKDQTTAQQHAAVIAAVTNFMADTTVGGGQSWIQGLAANSFANLPLPTSNTSVTNCKASIGATWQNLCNYLPTGFISTTTNPYGQKYNIQILKDASAAGVVPNAYSFMVVTNSGTTIPDTDGGRISQLIGGDGGFIFQSATVCGASVPEACGALGAWQVTNITSSYGFGAPAVGTVASRTYVTNASNSSYTWLARIAMPGDSTYIYNSMVTDLYMGAKQAGTSSPTSSTSPALHLQTGFVDGSGSSALGTPQISLVATTANYSTAGNSLISLSTGGCSALSNGGIFAPTCPAALNVLTGDISVPNGLVSAKKVYSASDIRLKKDIHPIEDPLAELMKVAPVAFTFKDSDSKSMGVIAQQLEKVYPELVLDRDGTKYVEYNGLIGPLIGAVQELKHQNDDLREQLHEQAQREERLERALDGKKAAP